MSKDMKDIRWADIEDGAHTLDNVREVNARLTPLQWVVLYEILEAYKGKWFADRRILQQINNMEFAFVMKEDNGSSRG